MMAFETSGIDSSSISCKFCGVSEVSMVIVLIGFSLFRGIVGNLGIAYPP